MCGPACPWDLCPGLGVWPLTRDLPSFLKTSIALSGRLPTPPAAQVWAIFSRPAPQAGRASVYIAVPATPSSNSVAFLFPANNVFRGKAISHHGLCYLLLFLPPSGGWGHATPWKGSGSPLHALGEFSLLNCAALGIPERYLGTLPEGPKGLPQTFGRFLEPGKSSLGNLHQLFKPGPES